MRAGPIMPDHKEVLVTAGSIRCLGGWGGEAGGEHGVDTARPSAGCCITVRCKVTFSGRRCA
jgi:hypothetical protein